ncbi:MAG: 4Fe-4S binding protein [Bacillota bacterium]|nr:4Fe-4S binding protein [Bacillota bacterium]
MGRVTVNEEYCKGCGLCVYFCPKNILQLSKTRLNAKGYPPAEVIDMEQCTGCVFCARMCPDSALTVEK